MGIDRSGTLAAVCSAREGTVTPQFAPLSLRRLCPMLAASLVYCSEAPRTAPSETGPRVESLGSVRLQERDSMIVAKPLAVAIDPLDGSYYIADNFVGRVTRWSRQGEFVTAYGAASVPRAKTKYLWSVFLVDSSVVLVDLSARELRSFDRRTGALVGTRSFRGVPWRIISAQDGDSVWLGARDPARSTAVLRWDVTNDSVAGLATLPAAFTRDRRLGPFIEVPLARWADTLLVGFSPTALRLLDSRGTLLDTITVPARRRRGWSTAALRRVDPRNGPGLVTAVSSLFGVHRLPSAETALLYYDYHQRGGGLSALIFVTLLSNDRRRACVDTQIPISADLLPVTQMRGDTLFVLSQRVIGGKPTAIISLFRITNEQCVWTAVD